MAHERLEEVTDQIFLVRGETNGRFPHAHSFLIIADETVLIDTGCGITLLHELNREFDISYIINSHTHPDHSAGNWIFHNCRIFVPQEAFSTSGDIDALSQRFVGDVLAPIWQQFARTEMGFQNCRPTHSYNNETIFRIGDLDLVTIHTPGHTQDHYCFYHKPKRILFSFDYDLTSFPWYGHNESSLEEFRQSIQYLKSLPSNVILSSHRDIITREIQSEWNNYIQRLDERNQRILDLLTSPKTIAELVDAAPIYRKFPYQEPLLRYWEGIMIQQHLKELENNGQVYQIDEKFHQIKK